jgi:integrase
MKGHKRYRAGAWRLAVAAGTDPVTGRRRSIYDTVSAPNNRAGAKLADARLAELVVAVESGHDVPSQGGRRGPLINELAQAWQQSNRPRRDPRGGDWIGWSPKTTKTVRDNFRFHVLPTIGRRHAADLTALELDRLYERLLDSGLSPTLVLRSHGQVRAMFNWAVRKKLATANPALAADPPRVKPRVLAVPTMAQVRAVQEEATPAFAAFLQLAATLGARRGTLLALRWGDIDMRRATITFSRAIAESTEGPVEKGTKAERPYTVSLGPDTKRVLAEHRLRSAEQALAVGNPFGRTSFVFSDDGGVSHWSLAWPSHGWAMYSQRAGVRGLRLHDLRHTAASQMLMAGCPFPSSPSGWAARKATSCATIATSSLGRIMTPPC